MTYPDPDIITIDPSFNALRVGNTPIQRLWTGGMWCEGPAWNGQGQYLIWSDIPNNRQLRWLQDDGQVTVFRQPSGHSNGNTFDHQGRQLSCEHSGRRVVRYEHDGSVTVIADSYQGKRLNSPNDVACHIDGSYWFSDPPYGGQIYEGMPDAPGGPGNKQGRLNAKVGQPAGSGVLKRELSNNIYRVDPERPHRHGDQRGGVRRYSERRVFFTGLQTALRLQPRFGVHVRCRRQAPQVTNQRQFADFMVDAVRCGTDGVRTDVFGNLWASSNAGLNVGYSGVTVWNPDGKLIGRIRLPEVCANICFGGPKRNRLFMAAGQSLYAVYTNTQGSSPG